MKCWLLPIALVLTLGLCAQTPTLVMPIGHTASVSKTLFSPNGKFVLTASWDGSAKLWDRITGKLLQTYAVHKSKINDIAFNHDGSLIATGSDDSTYAVWETFSGKIKFHYGANSYITSVQFNRNSTELMVSPFKDTIRIIDPATGYLIENIFIRGLRDGHYNKNDRYTIYRFEDDDVGVCTRDSGNVGCIWLRGNDGAITAVEILEKDSTIITTSRDSTLRYWNMKGQLLRTVRLNYSIETVNLSADHAKMILIAAFSPFAEIRNVKDTSLIATIGLNDTKYSNRIKAKFAPVGNNLLIAADDDNESTLYSVTDTMMQVRHFATRQSQVYDIAFSPGGNQFVMSFSPGPELWQADRSMPVASFKGHAHDKRFAQPVLNDSLMIVGSENTQVELWDNTKHELLYTLQRYIPKLSLISVSPSEKTFITSDWNNTLQLWETVSGKLLKEIPAGRLPADQMQVVPLWADAHSGPTGTPSLVDSFALTDYTFDKLTFSPDERFVVTTTKETNAIPVWDLTTGKMLLNVNIGEDGVTDIAFSPDSKKIAASGRNGRAVLIDIATKKIDLLEGHRGAVTQVEFHPSGRWVLTTGMDSTIKLFDGVTGKRLFSKNIGVTDNLLITANGGKVLASNSNTLDVYDFNTMRTLQRISADDKKIWRLQLLSDQTKVLTEFFDATPVIADIETGKVKFYPQLSGSFNKVTVSKSGQQVITFNGNKVSHWNAGTGELVSSYFTVDSADYFAAIPGNYYLSTPNAARMLHYVTPALDIVSFEQLDVKFNRPDKVLKAIGNKDSTLINSYKRAYDKRVKKLGIDTTQFRAGYNVPVAVFNNINAIQYEQSSPALKLQVKAHDSLYTLHSFNIWINDVPLYGMKGIQLNRKPQQSFDTTVTIILSSGINRIETSVTNGSGTESYRMPLMVNYTAAPKREQIYFIGIGINHFADSTHNLEWCVKDIRDLALALQKKYKDIIIDTLFDKAVTKQNILALKQQLMKLSEDDKVIIAYSGHGLLGKDLDYFLSTYNINFSKPEQNGLAYDEMENLLDGIRPRKKLMLIDACHSGEVDKEEIARIDAAGESLDSMGTKVKSTIRISGKSKMGMTNSFELMQNVFANVSRGTGATIISAAGGLQYAQERGDLKNGVFTYSMLNAFRQYDTLTVSQLKKIVSESVVRLTNGLQKPTSRNETNNYDWVIW